MRIRTIAAALTAATFACAPARRPARENATMTTLEWKGQQGGPGEPGSVVASDRAAWEDAWRRVGADAPALDFAAYVGVMVFLGQKPTGGYSVVFDEPVARGDDLVVRYRAPKPGGFAAQVLTRPWKARAFARPKGSVIVEAAAP
ncbi:MAG: protease complex subunit PrcB family protein [Elusimicrobiota bacterium]